MCGRLMCCLKNEQDTYEYLNSKLPNVKDEVSIVGGGKGVVHSINVLRQTVKLIITTDKDEKEIVEYPVSQLNIRQKFLEIGKDFGIASVLGEHDLGGFKALHR